MLETIVTYTFSLTLLAVFVYMLERLYEAMRIHYIFYNEFIRIGIRKKAAIMNVKYPSIFTDENTKEIISKYDSTTIFDKVKNFKS